MEPGVILLPSQTDVSSSLTQPRLANSYSSSQMAEITSDVGIASGCFTFERPGQPTDTLSLLDKITKRAKLCLVLMQDPSLVSVHRQEFLQLSAYLVAMGGKFTSSDPIDT